MLRFQKILAVFGALSSLVMFAAFYSRGIPGAGGWLASFCGSGPLLFRPKSRLGRSVLLKGECVQSI